MDNGIFNLHQQTLCLSWCYVAVTAFSFYWRLNLSVYKGQALLLIKSTAFSQTRKHLSQTKWIYTFVEPLLPGSTPCSYLLTYSTSRSWPSATTTTKALLNTLMELEKRTVTTSCSQRYLYTSNNSSTRVTNKFAEKGAVVSRAVEWITNEPPIQSAM